jgi:hypothetical protein
VKGASRLQRYNGLSKRKKQNSDFYKNCKEFFKQIEIDTDGLTGSELVAIDVNKFVKYWSSIWANPEVCNSSAAWINDKEACSYKVPVMVVNEFLLMM